MKCWRGLPTSDYLSDILTLILNKLTTFRQRHVCGEKIASRGNVWFFVRPEMKTKRRLQRFLSNRIQGWLHSWWSTESSWFFVGPKRCEILFDTAQALI